MKNLKILLIIFVGLLIVSCVKYKDPFETVKDPQQITLEVHNLPKDSVLLSVQDNMVYVYKMDSTLLIKTYVYDLNNRYDAPHPNVVVIMIIFIAILTFFLGFVVNHK